MADIININGPWRKLMPLPAPKRRCSICGTLFEGRDCPKLHQCSVCPRREHRNENWSWYVSIKQWVEGVPVAIFCSAACRKTYLEGR